MRAKLYQKSETGRTELAGDFYKADVFNFMKLFYLLTIFNFHSGFRLFARFVGMFNFTFPFLKTSRLLFRFFM